MNESLKIAAVLPSNESNSNHHPVERPSLFTEHLPHDPMMVLQEVFATPTRCKRLTDFLLGREDSTEDGDQTPVLLKFYADLLSLVEALHRLHQQHEKATVGESKATNPLQVIGDFCWKYPEIYVKRELWCLLHAGIGIACENPEGCLPGEVLDWYEQLTGLTQAAYLLNGKMEMAA